MKNILKTFLIVFGAVLFFSACTKTKELPYYKSGIAPVLVSDVTAYAPMPADSDNTVLKLSWSNPGYATDSSTIKYLIQIDTSTDFSHAYVREITGVDSTSFIAKDFNSILLGFGLNFGETYNVSIRIVSSYANNNDQKISNTITIQATPYVVPAKVLPPQSGTLFLVGSATAGGWDNPVPVPAQAFTKIDSLTYQGTFYLASGQQYLMLPVNGSWDEKYAVEDNTVPNLSAGGDFGYYSNANPTSFNSNFPAPAVSGFYTIWVDFQHGKFTVTSVKTFSLLYVPGGYQGWNPSVAPTLASVNSDGNYEGYVNVSASTTDFGFKLNTQPDWNGTNYGDGGSGMLSSTGGNLIFPGPGYYKINANTNDNTWSLTSTTWSLIGSFAASGWSNDVDMTYDNGSNSWSATITTAAGDVFKFRANHDWGLNYGDKNADGSLEQDGDNISITPGTHTIKLYLGSSGFYTYKIQ